MYDKAMVGLRATGVSLIKQIQDEIYFNIKSIN